MLVDNSGSKLKVDDLVNYQWETMAGQIEQGPFIELKSMTAPSCPSTLLFAVILDSDLRWLSLSLPLLLNQIAMRGRGRVTLNFVLPGALDEVVGALIGLGDWITERGGAFGLDGDDWKPGAVFDVSRTIEINCSPLETCELGLATGQSVGIAARWSCRSTSRAGVHDGGPLPLPISEHSQVTLQLPRGRKHG